MKKLKPKELAFWNSYVATLKPSEIPQDLFVEASYAGHRNITDTLLNLYLAGKKSAGSSVLEDFLTVGDPVPRVGNFWILLDSHDEPRLILRTERIETHKFKDVPLSVALAEGEGDLSLEYWREGHARFYTPFLKAWGIRHIDEATIVTEFYKIVYPPENLI